MNTIEQASWLGNRPAGIIESFLKYTGENASILIDGAYLGGSGEGIIIPFYNKDIGKMDIGLYGHNDGVQIKASNPGIKIVVSRFLSSQTSGNVLAVLDGKEMIPIEHAEAENEGLLEVKAYQDIFMYNGNIGAARLFQKMQILENEFLGDNPSEQDQEELAEFRESYECAPELPNYAYQVTEKGHGNLFLMNRVAQNSPINVGGMQLIH